MTMEEIKKLISEGEKIDVEFKKSENELNKDVYETVCSFNNRNGGYIFLGIIDGTREIRGVNPEKVDSMMKNFTTTVNNPNRINPPMYLSPKDIEIDGKKIIYIRVPEGTQVRRLNGRIMDRTYEGDIDITDAIFRVKNLDRYDDREVIITNLIDSYRRLMDFGKKHLNDVFVLDGDQSVSARDKILREIVSNILSHRDYANAYTAQFVIERDVMYTKNSNLPHGHGELQLNRFEPFPKNPPISKVFREIGYADELGSGMRNTNKYTKLYSGGTPAFIEDNIFEIQIPIANVAGLQVGPEETEKVPIKSADKKVPIKSADKKVPITGMSKKYQSKTLQNFSDIEKYLKENGETSTSVLCEALGIKERRMRDILSDMEQEGIIVGTGEKRDRRYGIREK